MPEDVSAAFPVSKAKFRVIYQHYNIDMKKNPDYQAPAMEEIPVLSSSTLCGSNLPGGNEDIGFEDWS